jgi:hypothetical protein
VLPGTSAHLETTKWKYDTMTAFAERLEIFPPRRFGTSLYFTLLYAGNIVDLLILSLFESVLEMLM